jgi:hypothetical protein
MSTFTEAVEKALVGLRHVSAGACPGCDECGLSENCDPYEYEAAEEEHFSWHSCDCCGSHLGGSRSPAHGFMGLDGKEVLVHLDVCTDCLVYLANGEEPEDWKP